MLNGAAQNTSGLMVSPIDPKPLCAPLNAINEWLPVENGVSTFEDTDSINWQLLVSEGAFR